MLMVLKMRLCLMGLIVLVMVAAVLTAPELALVIPEYRWFLRVLWWSAAGSAVLAALIYIRNGSRYIEHFERAQDKSAEARTD